MTRKPALSFTVTITGGRAHLTHQSCACEKLFKNPLRRLNPPPTEPRAIFVRFKRAALVRLKTQRGRREQQTEQQLLKLQFNVNKVSILDCACVELTRADKETVETL